MQTAMSQSDIKPGFEIINNYQSNTMCILVYFWVLFYEHFNFYDIFLFKAL